MKEWKDYRPAETDREAGTQERLEEIFRQKTEKMRAEYENIQIPESTRERIKEGIRMAREIRANEQTGICMEIHKNQKIQEKENIQISQEISQESALTERRKAEGNTQNKGGRKMGRYVWLRNTAAVAAAVLVAVGTLANVSPVTANAMEKVPFIGALAKVMTFRTFEDQEGNFSGKVDIPRIDSENGAEAAANKEIEEYAESLNAMYEADLKESNGEGNYSLESGYDVVFQNEKYVSIRINTTLVMASGTEFVKVFTVDKNTGNVVSLSQAVNGDTELLKKISENIKEQMRAQMKEDDSVVYFCDSDMPETDFKSLTGEESYYFSESGELVICFDEYEVAPGYMGAVSFNIPIDITGDLSK